MKLSIRFFMLIVIFILSGCNLGSETKSTASPSQFENQHLSVAYDGLANTNKDAENGFYMTFQIDQIGPYPLDDKHFSFALQRVIEDDVGNQYESVKTEIITEKENGETLPEGTVYFRQYFKPELNIESSKLSVLFYAKPLYYQQTVLFEELDHDSENVVVNDLNIARVKTDKNKLTLYIEDVHNIQGLETTMVHGGEEIYPVFSSTEIGKFNHSIIANHEFAINIPDPFTLKVKRHRLQDMLWDYPITITLK